MLKSGSYQTLQNMRWNDLQMSDIADIIKQAVKTGVTNLEDIKETFEYYQWKKAMQTHRGWEHDLDEDNTYNYRQYYHDNPEEAWSMLDENPDAHFYDTYKTATHPTFSNESMYSGYKNEYNPQGLIGGTWHDDYNYQLSQSQWDNDWDTDETIKYLNENEKHPVNFTSPEGANILRSLTVYPKKYGRGGHLYDGNTEDTQQINTQQRNKEMPWYKSVFYNLIGTPTVEGSSLKEAIFNAYDAGLKDETIIWNNYPYKATLNDSDYTEYTQKRYLDEKPTFTWGFPLEDQPSTQEDAIERLFSKYPTSPNSSWEEAQEWINQHGYIDYMASQARAIQKSRVLNARAQDPVHTGRQSIPLSDINTDKNDIGSKFDLRLLAYNPDVIDLIANNLPKGYDIYEALTLPIHETHLGINGTNLSEEEGYIRALINNHKYELDLGYFNDIAQYVRNVVKKNPGESSKDYKKRINGLIKETHDLETFKQNHPDIYNAMNDDAKIRFTKKRWEENNSEYNTGDISYMMHALTQYQNGTYNQGEPNYVPNTKKYTNILRRSKNLQRYLKSKGYIK